MTNSSRIAVSTDELLPFREAMRDMQEGVSAYYAETARGGDLGGSVRTLLVRVQTLNDLLTNAISDAASYKALFVPPMSAGAQLINAVKYARNVSQHVLHIVRPSVDSLVGGALGMRVYAYWESVPPDAHAKLRAGTQALVSAYNAALLGNEVTGTMLAVLRFFAQTAPELVHRDHRGEWTGFPLMSQPSMMAPLHPEEPSDRTAARLWLDGRPPNGDVRVVCGQITMGDARYVFGFTFIGRHSFAPFVETIEQADRDIDTGFPYLLGEPAGNIEDVSEQFPQARQGAVFRSRDEVTAWASPITRAPQDEDWYTLFGAEDWRRLVRMEHPGAFPDGMTYEVRRARRLNAVVPPSG